jgi:hypothetical protein
MRVAAPLTLLSLSALTGLVAWRCSDEPPPEPPALPVPPPAPIAAGPIQEPLTGGPLPTLLVTSAQFSKDASGKPRPGFALLSLWRKAATGWTPTRLEDPGSNVFHKAIARPEGIYTVGAEGAQLKRWTFADGKWTGVSLWNPKWDGKFNRIRDLEIGDVNGDGVDDFVMATHDVGVIGIGQEKGGVVTVTELHRKPDTFVHEIELGDVDGDGRREIFATPSGRNQSSGKSQGGQVLMLKWDGASFAETVVDSWEGTHAKEILAVDLDGKGKSTLFSVIEAETELGPDGKAKIVKPVEVRQYRFGKGAPAHSAAATIDDRQCRFLVPGDFDGDGSLDLVAAAMTSGLWWLRRSGDAWTATNFERNSSGFEHASYAADLDGDGKLELYVAADDQRELVSYRFDAATQLFSREVLGAIPKDTITWNITSGTL